MSNLLQTGAEFEKKLKERAESTETMLNDEFSKLEKSVSKAVTSNETKIKDAIALFIDRNLNPQKTKKAPQN
uniref:MbeB family mobilization protein n=1 Tax=Escherichia coli TaxID=562 RepID=UPI00207CCA60